MRAFQQYLGHFLKGMAMGGANVIPGVSGGTIAFITGIYERLIDALKAFNGKGIKLLLKGKIKEFLRHIDIGFLLALFMGIGVSLISLGKLLKWLMVDYEVQVWALFFGLILASVWSVGRTIDKWNAAAIGGLLVGTVIAVSISFINQAEPNEGFVYLMLCGVVAICSMLLPGLSGSFVLLLMGNYELIMLDAVPDRNVTILIPVAIGAAVGFVALSHSISYLLKHFKLATLGVLTGFVLGSLLVIWPWKNTLFLKDAEGTFVMKEGEKIVEGYERYLPSANNADTWWAIGLIVLGAAMVVALDLYGKKKLKEKAVA